MHQDVVYIVGDNFLSFAQLENVYTYSQVIEMVKSNNMDNLREFICVLGQGLNSEEKRQLELYSRKNWIGLVINGLQRPASHDLTHKYRSENIMITEPLTVLSGKRYRACLIIDDSCAEMSDHLTGKHIQGMVLTEAARQMMLAVAEKYILESDEQKNSYCILNSVSSHFFHFAFPVDIRIEHEIYELKKVDEKGYDVKTRTHFIQSDAIIAYVDIEYKFYKKDLLLMIENKVADKVIISHSNIHLENLFTDAAA